MLKTAVFPRYSRFLSLQIVKTVNNKTANSEGRQYSQAQHDDLELVFLTL